MACLPSRDSATSAIGATVGGTDGTTVTDSATTVLGAIGADNTNNAFASTSVVANADGSVLERIEYLQSLGLSMPLCCEKSDGAVLTGTDTLFTISGGPIKVLEIAPPGVQTDLMPGHAENPNSMPLDAYIAETMALLEANPHGPENAVERVKFLRDAEREGRYDAVFAALNQSH